MKLSYLVDGYLKNLTWFCVFISALMFVSGILGFLPAWVVSREAYVYWTTLIVFGALISYRKVPLVRPIVDAGADAIGFIIEAVLAVTRGATKLSKKIADSLSKFEEIHKVMFLNVGECDEHSGTDFFDHLFPGLAVLYLEGKVLLCHYPQKRNQTDIERIDTIQNLVTWKDAAAQIFSAQVKSADQKYLRSLIECIEDEDEDGLYEHLQQHGGEVVFENPNAEVESCVTTFIVKQEAHGDFSTDGNEFRYGGEKIPLVELNSGLFDGNNELAAFWKP